jgi:hypothetical protein
LLYNTLFTASFMDEVLLTKSRIVGLLLSLLALSLGTPQSAWAGKTSAGGGSGVTTGGSVPLPIGGSPLVEETTTSLSPNVALDPQTGNLLLTARAQASLNQTARQIIQQLQARYPALIPALNDPLVVNPDSQIDTLALAIRGINDNEPVAKPSLRVAAVDAREQAINQFRWAELYIDLQVLELTAPLVTSASGEEYAMAAIYTPPGGGDPSVLELQGTLDELGNAAAFLVITTGSDIDPGAIEPFVSMATAGAPYERLLDLLIAVNSLVRADAAGADIDPNQLNQAIYAYRAIVETVDPATLNRLGNNADFVALREALQNLRDAVDA